MSDLRFAVMGAGAIGGYCGARLAAAGEDVTFIARGAHLDAMRKNGLVVKSPLGDVTIDPVTATDDPGEVGPVDVILFMVKLYDTETAARQMAPMIGAETVVVPFQNGIDVAQRFAGLVEPERLMGGAIYIPAGIEAPGVIRHGGSIARLVFGEIEGGESARAERLKATFEGAGIDAHVATDTTKALWQKFLMLSAFSAVTSLARLPIGPIWAHEAGRRLFAAAMGETYAVGRALGVDLDDAMVERQIASVDTLPTGMKSSMLQDLEAGKRLEVAHLSGALVELGDSLGIDVPIHRTVLAMLLPWAEGPPDPV